MTLMSKNNEEGYSGDIFIACNMAGIYFLLVYSIMQRKKLFKLKLELDKDKDTPSDYALLIRNVDPKAITSKLLED